MKRGKSISEHVPAPSASTRLAWRVWRTPFRKIQSGLAAFADDVRGLGAVEFALVAPILLLMLLGAVEITRAVSIDQRVNAVTNMIADLVARETQLTAADIEAMYDIAEQVMAPYDASKLKLSIIPVMSSASNAKRTLVYSSTTNRPSYNGGDVPAKCQAYALANGLLKENESVIVIEATYAFSPLIAGYVMDSQDWSEKALAKPRKSLCVAFDGANCTSSCFSS